MVKSNQHAGELLKQLSKASVLAKFVFWMAIVFLGLSVCIPQLLAITGTFMVVAAGIFNTDIQRYDSHINEEIRKAETLNEFQSYLLSVIRDFGAVRANYERMFSENDEDKVNPHSAQRAMAIPYIPILPVFDAENIRKLFGRLSFTASLLGEVEAKKLHLAPDSEKAKSLSYLAYYLESPSKLTELWKVRNELYQNCRKEPYKNDYRIVKLVVRDANDIHTLDNYLAATDYCLIQTDEILYWAQLALSNFIPAAKKLIADEALDKCVIPSLSNEMFSSEFLFKKLTKEEQNSREVNLAKKFNAIKESEDNSLKSG